MKCLNIFQTFVLLAFVAYGTEARSVEGERQIDSVLSIDPIPVDSVLSIDPLTTTTRSVEPEKPEQNLHKIKDVCRNAVDITAILEEKEKVDVQDYATLIRHEDNTLQLSHEDLLFNPFCETIKKVKENKCGQTHECSGEESNIKSQDEDLVERVNKKLAMMLGQFAEHADKNDDCVLDEARIEGMYMGLNNNNMCCFIKQVREKNPNNC